MTIPENVIVPVIAVLFSLAYWSISTLCYFNYLDWRQWRTWKTVHCTCIEYVCMCMWLWPLTITIIMLLMFVCKNKCMQKWHLCGCGASSPCCPAQAPTSPGSCWTPSWSCGRIHHCGNILHQNCKCEIFMKQIECKLVQVLLNIAQLYFILSTLRKKLSWTQYEPLICMCPKLIGSFFIPGNVFLNRSPKTIW